MTDDFFENKEDKKEGQDQPEKIKLGDTEFSPEELQQLVGYGKKAKEWEEKSGSSFDELKTKFGKRAEVIGKYKKENEELQTKLKSLENPPPKEVQDKEKVKEQIIAEAREFGLLTKAEAEEMFKNLYQVNRSGEKLLTKVSRVLKQAQRDGNPTTTTQSLLEFMADPSNPKDPEKAYKMMFEKELDDIKQKKLMSIKRNEFVTEEGGNAGSKQPDVKVPKNHEELKQSLLEHLTASE